MIALQRIVFDVQKKALRGLRRPVPEKAGWIREKPAFPEEMLSQTLTESEPEMTAEFCRMPAGRRPAGKRLKQFGRSGAGDVLPEFTGNRSSLLFGFLAVFQGRTGALRADRRLFRLP